MAAREQISSAAVTTKLSPVGFCDGLQCVSGQTLMDLLLGYTCGSVVGIKSTMRLHKLTAGSHTHFSSEVWPIHLSNLQ